VTDGRFEEQPHEELHKEDELVDETEETIPIDLTRDINDADVVRLLAQTSQATKLRIHCQGINGIGIRQSACFQRNPIWKNFCCLLCEPMDGRFRFAAQSRRRSQINYASDVWIFRTKQLGEGFYRLSCAWLAVAVYHDEAKAWPRSAASTYHRFRGCYTK